MTNQETKNKYAEILAKAQAKALAQSTRQPQETAKPTPKPTPKPEPEVKAVQQVATYRVVTKDNLISRYKEQPAPELSDVTIDDLVGELVPVSVQDSVQPDIRLVDYSDKSIAVVGNTKPRKDTLKAIGGKYNPYLKCGGGWIFPKWKEAEIRAVFNL